MFNNITSNNSRWLVIAMAITLLLSAYIFAVSSAQVLYWRYALDDAEVCRHVPQCRAAAVTPVLNSSTANRGWRVQVASDASPDAINAGLRQWVTQTSAGNFASDLYVVRTPNPTR